MAPTNYSGAFGALLRVGGRRDTIKKSNAVSGLAASTHRARDICLRDRCRLSAEFPLATERDKTRQNGDQSFENGGRDY